jgi:hypothetical protein
MLKRGLIVITVLLFHASLAHAQLGTSSGTTTVNVTVGAEAALSIVTGTTTLTSAGTNFSSYTGTTNLTYFVRTSAASGSGTITLQVTSDFSPAGGPSVATPPTAGDALKYTCTVAAPGNNGTATPCSGSVTASTATATTVGTFGADARSLFGGNTAAVSWTLTNDPKYKTGSYSGTATFTISAS